MPDINELILAFAQLGDMEYEEASRWKELIVTETKCVLLKLREGVNIEENIERITQACAASAYCTFCMVQSLNKSENIKIDGIAVANNNGEICRNAKNVRKKYLELISDLLKTSSVAFEGVEIHI